MSSLAITLYRPKIIANVRKLSDIKGNRLNESWVDVMLKSIIGNVT